MGNEERLITVDKALMGGDTNNIIEFAKRKAGNDFSEKASLFLMDTEVDEAISLLLKIKEAVNAEERTLLEHDFYGIVQNAWCREMGDIVYE